MAPEPPSSVYGVQPNDPATLIMVTAALVAVSLFAAWLPARRAAQVNPIEGAAMRINE